MTQEHVFQVVEHVGTDKFWADCSCGYVGEDRSSFEKAEEDWENHCEAAFIERTEKLSEGN